MIYKIQFDNIKYCWFVATKVKPGVKQVHTRKIGRSDLEVSVLGLGCNNLGGRLDEAASIRVVNAAMDIGVTMFDVA